MLLIVLENDMYVRNFVSSGALDGLLERPDCKISPSELLETLEEALLKRGFDPSTKIAAPFARTAVNVRLTLEFNILSMRALAAHSTTFALKTQKNLYRSTTSWSRLYPWLAPIMRLPGVLNQTRRFFSRLFHPNPSLSSVLKAECPSVVIFPITGVEATGTELVRLSRTCHFKTVFLTNGWDNLSSKGVFVELPDILGVWGPQSARHAITCQGMPASQPQRIALLGCSRYEDYFRQTEGLPPLFDFPYVLFAGATTACDEVSALRLIERQLAQLKADGQCPDALKVVYRPHPWREPRNKRCDDCVNPDDFKHVILDPQVAEGYLKNKQLKQESVSANHYPALDYYTRLLQHTLMVVSPMSSMTLEAALFDVPSLILAMDDGLHRIPCHLQANYAHFEGGRQVPGWVYADTLTEVAEKFSALLQQVKQDTPAVRQYRPHLREAMRQYLTWAEAAENPPSTYATRLSRVVAPLI